MKADLCHGLINFLLVFCLMGGNNISYKRRKRQKWSSCLNSHVLCGKNTVIFYEWSAHQKCTQLLVPSVIPSSEKYETVRTGLQPSAALGKDRELEDRASEFPASGMWDEEDHVVALKESHMCSRKAVFDASQIQGRHSGHHVTYVSIHSSQHAQGRLQDCYLFQQCSSCHYQ